MYTVSLQVIPIIKGEKELAGIIDAVVEVIKASGLKYEVNAHSTVVEGEKEDLLKLLQDVINTCERLSKRTVITFQIDLKPGGVSIDEKTKKYRMGP